MGWGKAGLKGCKSRGSRADKEESFTGINIITFFFRYELVKLWGSSLSLFSFLCNCSCRQVRWLVRLYTLRKWKSQATRCVRITWATSQMGLKFCRWRKKEIKKLPQWCVHDFVGQFNGLGPLFLIFLIFFSFFWILPLGYFDQGRDQVTPITNLWKIKQVLVTNLSSYPHTYSFEIRQKFII